MDTNTKGIEIKGNGIEATYCLPVMDVMPSRNMNAQDIAITYRPESEHLDLINNIKISKMYFVCTRCGSVGDTDHYKKNSAIYLDDLSSAKLICNECLCGGVNTVKPTSDELLISSFSKYNFITSFDHNPPKIVVQDINEPHGVRLAHNLTMDDINDVFMGNDEDMGISEYLKKLEHDAKNTKLPNKTKRLIVEPNKTIIIIELAELKRKCKLAKRDNNKMLAKSITEEMDMLKEKLAKTVG